MRLIRFTISIILIFISCSNTLALSQSPYAGKVVINEILYKQTCGGLANATVNDEFIELYFNDDVDISNWIISDGNVVDGDTDGPGSFSFTFPEGSSFNAGDYVVIWIGNSNDPYNLKNAVNAKAQFYVGKSVKLDNNGDDVWLFDANGKIVDYVAYGSNHGINDQSNLPVNFWINNVDANPSNGQSISLTPNGVDSNNGNDWEATTSGDAPGPITIDSDYGSCNGNERISSAGVNNNKEPELIKGHVYEDLYPLGINNGEDLPIEDAKVYLFRDNGNGVIDSNDVIINSTTTDPNGYYSFPVYSGLYFIVVDSKTVNTARGLNLGYSKDRIWAEQTYQTEYNGNWNLVKKFGGQNINVSDDFSNSVYEHWTVVNISKYNGVSIDFGFSFEVVVNVRDADDVGTYASTGKGRSAQGTLRQFLENARAIFGVDKSYFIFNINSNTIVVDQNLYMCYGNSYCRAGHPSYVVDDSTILDGKILNWDLSPRGDRVVVKGIGCLTDCLLFLATNKATMENMEIVGNSATVNNTGIRGVRLSEISYGIFKNLKIHECHIGIELYWNCQHNVLTNIESYNNTHSGIYFYWTTGSHNNYNVVNNSKLYNNKYIGIGLYYDSDYNKLENNEIYNNEWVGIWIGYYCDYDEIRSNHVYNNKVSGILISTWPGYQATNNIVEGNIVENNGGFWGTIPNWATVEYDSGIGLYNANNNLIKNNIIKNNYHPNGPVYGIAIEDSSNNLIESNEIVSNEIGIVILSKNSKNNTFTRNSIYKNKKLGIDLGNDGVTLNDGGFSSFANDGIDYPLFKKAKLTGNILHVEGYINNEDAGYGSSNFANSIVEVFLVNNTNGDDLVGNYYNGKVYGEGWKYLGSLTADTNGNFAGDMNIAGLPISSNSLITGTATLNGKGTSEFGANIKIEALNLEIIKEDYPDPIIAGKALNYKIKVTNTGGFTLNAVIKDGLDENTTYLNSSGIYYSSNHTIVWMVTLNPLQSVTLELNVSVNNNLPDGYVIRNYANVSSNGTIYDETWQNTTVLAANIYDPKTVVDLNGLPTQPGDILEYSIWINNTGSLDTIAKLVDPIPEHTSYANYVFASQGTAYYNSSNNSIEWNGSIPAGSGVNIRFRVKIDAPLQDTTISNQGLVYYDSNNDGIIDSVKPTDDPNTNEAYDPTNVTVKSPKVELTKTVTKAEYGKNVTFTIKLCVEGYLTNVTLIEHYPPKLIFVEASIPPTEGDNIWKFKKLQDECVEIKIKMYIPAYYYELEMSGSVKGNGIVLANKEFYTGIKSMDIVNRVTLTCDQGIKRESKALFTIREKKGNFASISEHGIGNYSSDESIKVKRCIIYIKKSVDADTDNSTWSVKYCLKNRYGDFIKKGVYGTRIEDVTNAKSSTPKMGSKTKVNGSYLLKVVSDFRMCEKYSGNFEINERIDGDADINVNGSGIGIFEEKANSHAMFERGIGDYSSKTYFNELYFDKKTKAKGYYQKVCYFNNSNYVSATTYGDYSTEIKGYAVLNYTLSSVFNGTSKFKVKIGNIGVDELYAGKFKLKKEISASYPKTTWIPDGKIGDGEYENKTTFDCFEIYWKSDEKYLYMAIKANTTGWLRIGFAMCCFNTSYDYIVGFVADGKTKVLDMYYNGTLMLDKEICGCFGCGKQSISKFGGSENGYTIIEFKRKLNTRDVYDARLKKGAEVGIAWAYGRDDDVWSDAIRSGYGRIVI